MVFEKQLTQTLQYLVDKIHIKSSIKHDEYDFLVHTTVILEIKRIYYIYNIKLKLIFSFCHFVIVICHIVTFIIITSKRLASFLDVTKKGESANITCTCKI